MSPSLAVTLTAHTLTILGIYIAHLAYIKAVLMQPETTHSKVVFPGRRPLRWPTHGEE